MMCVGVRACVMCAHMECVVGECMCVCVFWGYVRDHGRSQKEVKSEK